MPDFVPRGAAPRARRFIETLARDWLDAVTDRRCPGCGGTIARDRLVCPACDGGVGRLGSVLCLRCLHDGAGERGPGARGGERPEREPEPERGRGCARHGSARLLLAGPSYEAPLDAIVRAFKYEGASHLAPWVASLVPSIPAIGGAFHREALLVPAALHPARRAARGFDQALLLAECLGAWWGIPVAPILERTRETPPQARLDSIARRANVTGVYRLARGAEAMASGRPLLLVDDVATTGATLLAAAEALESARPSWILALTAAHGGAPGAGDGGEGAQSVAHAKVAAPGGVW